MDEYWLYFFVVTGAVFAGFIDAVVGGGGLVQVPLLLVLFPGLSHVHIIASNRFASVAGTSVAAFQYVRSIGVNTAVVVTAGIAAAISSFGGTFVMALVRPEVFKPMLLVIISALAVYSFLKKDMGQVHQPRFTGKQSLLVCTLIGLVLGFYNGFIGPGTGTLLVFSLVSVLGMNFLHASSSAKLINVMADLASLVGFIISKAVVFKIALPMMAGNMLGSYIGSKTAIARGSSFVRYVFLFVIAILIIRLAWDLFK